MLHQSEAAAADHSGDNDNMHKSGLAAICKARFCFGHCLVIISCDNDQDLIESYDKENA